MLINESHFKRWENHSLPFMRWESEVHWESQADLVKALSDAELCGGVPEEHLQANQSNIFARTPRSLITFHSTRQPRRNAQPWPTHDEHLQACKCSAGTGGLVYAEAREAFEVCVSPPGTLTY